MKQRLPYVIAFVAFALCLLVGLLQPFLRETAALTTFYTTGAFAAETISKPCGFLFYIACFLQSCLARPWLGACLFTAVLVAVAYVQKWAFRISDAWFGICWVAPFALLLNYTQLGYLIYTLKYPAVAFAPALGFLAVFCLMGLWLRLERWWWRIALMLLVPTVGYWLFGFYGLLVLPVLGFCELGIARWGLGRPRDSRNYHFLLGLALMVVGYLLPLLLRVVVQQPIDFWIGFISFSNAERQMRRSVAVLLALTALFPIFHWDSKRRWVMIVSIVVFIASGVATYIYTYRDANFHNTLEMKHAAEASDWEHILQLARANETEPTRAQVCLTRLALFKTGRMGNELFTYPDGSANYNAPQQNMWLRLMIGPLLYCHYGKTGFADRWAMEDMVEYGERPTYLRYLHKVAKLNGEEALTRRYAYALGHTLFYQEENLNPNDDSTSSPQEDENIQSLLNYTDQLDGDNGLIEFYLLQTFALSQGGSRPMVELSLMNSLITKNLTDFWPRFMALLPGWNGQIPVHYQEAALMVAQLQGGMDISTLPIDPNIRQRFDQLVQASAQNGDNASNAYALRPAFGDTYWYYYFFVEGLKTT